MFSGYAIESLTLKKPMYRETMYSVISHFVDHHDLFIFYIFSAQSNFILNWNIIALKYCLVFAVQ